MLTAPPVVLTMKLGTGHGRAESAVVAHVAVAQGERAVCPEGVVALYAAVGVVGRRGRRTKERCRNSVRRMRQRCTRSCASRRYS